MTHSYRTPSMSFNRLMLAGVIATAGFGAMAQPSGPTPPAAAPQSAGPMANGEPHRGMGRDMGPNMGPNMGRHMGRHDPAKMQARMAKRQAELKAKLNITPAQDAAWNAFTSAMQPPAQMGGRMAPEQRAQFDKLTTPERIDKMHEMRTSHMADMNAAMDKRGNATKALYAALAPEQQKTFDAEAQKHSGRMGHHGQPTRQHERGAIEGQKS